jgi:uncharacterized membrane protein
VQVGRPGLAVILGLATLLYGITLRHYGLELADEGVLLAQIDRVAHGQIPYRDFHTGYGPGMFLVNAALFDVFGASTATVRTGLAIVQAVRVGLAASLVASIGGGAWAVAVAGAVVAFFLPVAPGVCVPSSIPYPAWYASALGLGALLLLTRTRTRAGVAMIGVLAGAIFAFKQNSGLFVLGAAAVTLVLAPNNDGSDRRPGVGLALGAALLAAAYLLLRDFLDAPLVAAFVLPLVPLAVALARRPVSGRTIGDLVVLGVAFAAVAGTTVAAMIARAGVGPIRTDLLQIGSDIAQVFHQPYPTWGGALAQSAGASPARTVRLLGDAAWFTVLPIVHALGALLVATGRVRSRAAVAVVAAAAIGYLEIYPRMDFWHLLPIAATSLIAVVVVLTTIAPAMQRVALAGLIVASVVRFAPTVPVLLALGTPAPVDVSTGRLQVRFDLLDDERSRRVPEVVAALAGAGAVAGFPAFGIVNFGLGRPSPWRHDYFFPGRPGPAEEAALAAEVRRRPPDAVVVLDAGQGPFAEAFAAHPTMVEALRDRFVERERIGPYRILAPRPEPDA